ncbi:MAG: Mur ligase [Planctomycetes bacterium]|nr:Mur ligase [Planctomycetota bacterium]
MSELSQTSAPRDSRRLTGPNIVWDRIGACMEVDLPEGRAGEALLARWDAAAHALLVALDLRGECTAHRRFAGGASLAVSAPRDALYVATEIDEAAWDAAQRAVDGGAARGDHAAAGDVDAARDASPVFCVGPDGVAETFDATVARLRAAREAERNDALRVLEDAARARGVPCLADDDELSLGLGVHSVTFPARALPAPDAVAWDALRAVPFVLVTGTNGKTTTVRSLGAILRAAGRTPGFCSTDAIHVGDEVVERGDWSGPGGARRVLRDRRVDCAVLETARGGMLRRGLGVTGACAAAVTNIARDHEGEYGIFGEQGMAEAKLVIARGVREDGCVVLNADDPVSVAHAARVERELLWFGLDRRAPALAAQLARGGDAAFLDGDVLRLLRDGSERVALPVRDVPITLDGAARHNVANALVAIALADRMDVDADAIARGLSAFSGTDADNPGRLNRFELGGVTALVDFAHNPHGVAALAETARHVPAERRLVVLGQAGDRDDASIRALVAAALRMEPDRVVIKEMLADLRGRRPGEVPALVEDECVTRGLPRERIEHAPSELDAVRQALAWSRPGDLLLLLSHAQRGEVLALLHALEARGWRPGDAVG